MFAIRGVGGFARQPFEPSRGKPRHGCRLFLCGSDTVKTQLFNRLARPGELIRFSHALEPRYYEELTAEVRRVRMSKGRPQIRFERVGHKRAECLDSTVYALCARHALQLNLDLREAELRSAPAATASPAKPKEPWIGRSQFMSR